MLLSQEELLATLEQIGGGFIAFDAGWRFVHANRAAERMVGRSRDELLGRNHGEVFPLTVGTPLEEEFRRAAAGETREFEYYYAPRDRWFLNRCFPRPAGGMAVYFSDITGQKEAEKKVNDLTASLERKVAERTDDLIRTLESLRTTQENLAATLSALPDIMFRVERDGTILEYHAASLEDLYLPPEAFLGKKVAEVLPEEAASIIMASLGAAAERGRHSGATYSLSIPQGVRWYELSVAAQGDSREPAALFVMLVRNITRRKEAEGRLERLHRQVQTILDSAPVGIVMLIERRFVWVNRKVEELFQYQREVLEGESTRLIYSSATAYDQMNGVYRLLALGEEFDGVQEMVRRDGTTIWVRLHAKAVNPENLNEGTIWIAEDITEFKQNKESLRRYARRLIEMDEDLRRHLAAELHDGIASDLAATGMRMALIRQALPRPVPADVATHLDDAQAALIDINRKVRNLMAELRPPVLDDYGLAAALRWHCEKVQEYSDLAIIIDVPEDFPRLAPEQELALFRIVQEALANALKHARARTITISLGVTDSKVTVRVSDDGAGFDPGRSGQSQGLSGWGLTLMRERAESARGTIRIESLPGRGTTVIMSLPGEAPCLSEC